MNPAVSYFDPALGLIRKYGVNRSQFFVKPGLVLRGYHLNISRPLFHDNLALRQAVNFAVDRPAIVRQGGLASPLLGRPTDQYLPPSMPGFEDAHLYPLDGPDLRKARALARGHTRSGKAVLLDTRSAGPGRGRPGAQAEPGEDRPRGRDQAAATAGVLHAGREAGNPFDIAFSFWVADVPRSVPVRQRPLRRHRHRLRQLRAFRFDRIQRPDAHRVSPGGTSAIAPTACSTSSSPVTWRR